MIMLRAQQKVMSTTDHLLSILDQKTVMNFP